MFINKNFFLVWSGKFISMIGDRFYTLVLALWVLERSKSPLMMGAVLVASTLPAFILSFFSGAFVDMKNKKNIMIVTDLIRGLLILNIAYLEYTKNLSIQTIIITSAMISILNAFFEPAIKALIPEVVKEEELPKANGLEQLINGISNVVGPILGAAAIGGIGFLGGFIVNGISFILSAFFELFIQVSHKKISKNSENKFWDNLKEGFTYVSQRQMLKKVLIIIALVHFAVGSFTLILPFMANAISVNPMNLALLEGSFGLGLIIGATVLNIAKRKEGSLNLLIIYMSILGVTYGVVAVLSFMQVKMILPYLVFVMFMGITISNAATFWQLILQLNTPEELRGRVFSFVSAIANVSFPISFALIGILIEFIDFPIYLISLGFIMIILSVLWRGAFAEKKSVAENNI